MLKTVGERPPLTRGHPMDPADAAPQRDVRADSPLSATSAPGISDARSSFGARPMLGFTFVVLLAIVFGRDLYALFVHSAGNPLHSHVVLIPFVTAYLIYIDRAKLPHAYSSSFVFGGLAAALGVGATLGARALRNGGSINDGDYLSCVAASVILLLVGGGFLFLGSRWMKAAAFPAAFLLFSIPLPDSVADVLETASKIGSAEVANAFFNISGTPVLRDGFVFQLPGMVIEVAQECSGIRSSWVLLITSVLASYLFLRSGWRRTALVLAVIPLGLLRNGFRILIIGLLCVHIGPEMIDSAVHRRGGPAFFIFSLIPLFLLLHWLRKRDAPRGVQLGVSAPAR